MSKLIIAAILVACCGRVSAQWAVYDHEAVNQLKLLNKVETIDLTSQDTFKKPFKALKDLEEKAAHPTALGADFANLSDDEISDSDRELFTGAAEKDHACGSKGGNLSFYRACVNLRELRIRTLVHSQAILENIEKRREQIEALIKSGRDNVGGSGGSGGAGAGAGGAGGSTDTYSAGKLQRHQFELQGLQALMQSDMMELQILLNGYRERAKLYEQQQAEAANSANNASGSNKKSKAPAFIPFLDAD